MGLGSLGRLYLGERPEAGSRRKDSMLRWERTKSAKTALAELRRGWWDNQCAHILEDMCVGDMLRVKKERILIFL